ncbi:hypothetical protein A5N70_20915 [Prescottella equi]|nr:hypothetical protein A5N70_20915 [Prescottella equi]
MPDMTDATASPEPTTDPVRVLPVAEGAKRLGQTEAWYLRQLRARKLPGHKIGRKWMLTEGDVREAIERTAIQAIAPMPSGPFSSLSPTSRRRLQRGGK